MTSGGINHYTTWGRLYGVSFATMLISSLCIGHYIKAAWCRQYIVEKAMYYTKAVVVVVVVVVVVIVVFYWCLRLNSKSYHSYVLLPIQNDCAHNVAQLTLGEQPLIQKTYRWKSLFWFRATLHISIITSVKNTSRVCIFVSGWYHLPVWAFVAFNTGSGTRVKIPIAGMEN